MEGVGAEAEHIEVVVVGRDVKGDGSVRIAWPLGDGDGGGVAAAARPMLTMK